MGVLESLLRSLAELTYKLDEAPEVLDLSDWWDLMSLIHVLQVQAQMLIDIVLRASTLLGHPPRTPVDAIEHLRKLGVVDPNEASFFRAVLGFRNVVVHEYLEVDTGIVKKIMESKDYRKVLLLAEKIVRELRRRGLDP